MSLPKNLRGRDQHGFFSQTRSEEIDFYEKKTERKCLELKLMIQIAKNTIYFCHSMQTHVVWLDKLARLDSGQGFTPEAQNIYLD